MMTRNIFKTIFLFLAISLLFTQAVFSRAAYDKNTAKDLYNSLSAIDQPAYCIVSQDVGKIALGVNNNGTLGTGWAVGGTEDCITGDVVRSCEYPKNSNVEYLFAASFWIGAVIGRDTLVSTGADGWTTGCCEEFRPDVFGLGDMIYRTLREPESPDLYNGAISEEDYIARYSDTFPFVGQNTWGGELHTPLNIEVTQRSYAWSYSYAEDFVLFDYEVKNIGNSTIKAAYMGFYNDSDVGWTGVQDYHTDDICGFRETFVSTYEDVCQFEDTVNLAYIVDNDGDPVGGAFTDESCPHVTAMRIVRTPGDYPEVSFNWWISNGAAQFDYGPREREGVGAWEEDFRDFGTGGLGTPEGDRNKYYLLRNREFDFDQIRVAAVQPTDPIWSFPSGIDVANVSNGFDTRYLLSFGPFDIEPGEKLPISFAYVAGENFHQLPTNGAFLESGSYNPDTYYDNLNFADLALNSTWASRVYDNPGLDTDGDGDSGAVRTCCFDEAQTQCETFWYKGDGKPDFQGASPPPPPDFWLESSVGSIRVRFNGTKTETTTDVFSRIVDFEGYRVYVGLDQRESSFGVVASYDIEDYNKLVYNPNKLPEAGYELRDIPFTIDSLRILYGDDFTPLSYSIAQPYRMPGFPDSMFYFTPQDYNVSELGVSTRIEKVYPDQPYPSNLDPSLADPDELTEESLLKYFEYELTIDSLQPTIEWWVNVTAFDFGSPESGLQALESAKSAGAQAAYPLASSSEVAARGLKAYVYPNPYRGDADYREQGYEGRMDADRPDDRVREIHFANLPPKCTISIYTLDGDLVRQLEHDKSPDDPEASHEIWNMITRNTQMVASGLYYWVVESEDGEAQVGKLVIIM
ncbi:MAG: hypothetical protein AB1483_07875 [Candidatus Zixiibacteriota bacterium]